MKNESFEQAVDRIMAEKISDKTPGCTLLIAKDGKILLNKGYGMANLEKKIPITADSNFVIASNTKQFTCMAILMLYERGLLELEEPIERFFPDLAFAKKVTVRMLMSHTSGIWEYFDEGCFAANADYLRTADTKALLALAKTHENDRYFEEETRWSYCNTAYVMLGTIVTQLTGKPFGKFLETEIMAPLGMTHSCAPDYMDETDPLQVTGYEEKDGGFEPQPYDMLLVGYADGNISSNGADLLKWHKCLYEDHGAPLVKPETCAKLFENHELKDGTLTNYGLGFFLNCDSPKWKHYPGHHEIWHSGSSMGFISRVSRFTEDRVSAILLTNWSVINQDEILLPVLDELFSRS